MPHDDLHISNSKFYTVEFINTYDASPMYDSTVAISSITNKYIVPIENRMNNYYLPNLDRNPTSLELKEEDIGLYPHITYRSWLNMQNSNEMTFSEKIYDNKIWGEINLSETLTEQYISSNFIFNYHDGDSPDGWMYKLYELTYKYIKNGYTTNNDSILTDIEIYNHFSNNVINKSDVNYNILFHSNINHNGNMINLLDGSKNYNSVSYSSNAFPTSMFF